MTNFNLNNNLVIVLLLIILAALLLDIAVRALAWFSRQGRARKLYLALATLFGLWLIALAFDPVRAQRFGPGLPAIEAWFLGQWRTLDGFARTHPMIGLGLVVVTVVVLISDWEEEKHS